MSHPVAHHFLHDVKHAARRREDKNSVVLVAEIVHQTDEEDDLPRLLNQQIIRYVTDVELRRVLSNGCVQRVNVHSIHTAHTIDNSARTSWIQCRKILRSFYSTNTTPAKGLNRTKMQTHADPSVLRVPTKNWSRSLQYFSSYHIKGKVRQELIVPALPTYNWG